MGGSARGKQAPRAVAHRKILHVTPMRCAGQHFLDRARVGEEEARTQGVDSHVPNSHRIIHGGPHRLLLEPDTEDDENENRDAQHEERQRGQQLLPDSPGKEWLNHSGQICASLRSSALKSAPSALAASGLITSWGFSPCSLTLIAMPSAAYCGTQVRVVTLAFRAAVARSPISIARNGATYNTDGRWRGSAVVRVSRSRSMAIARIFRLLRVSCSAV